MINKCWLYLSRHANLESMSELMISDVKEQVKEVPKTKTAPEVFIDLVFFSSFLHELCL